MGTGFGTPHKTHHPRIVVENHGKGLWRTVAQDDSGEWGITGPAYPSKFAAFVAVDATAASYFG